MKDVLLYFAYKYNGDWDEIYNALDRKEKFDFDACEKIKKELDCKVITILDGEYPHRLKQIYKPPFVLFCRGNIDLLVKKSIAIVGTRKPSDYGIKEASIFTKKLCDENFVTVSGMASGIDSVVHNTTIENDASTIAVLGSGIDYVYPNCNVELYKKIIKDHLVISEYPNDTLPNKESFKARNRIVSGLANGVLVIEAAHKSGTMNTVSHALEQGKEVFCIPNKIDELSGTNLLIKQGAKLVETVSDILNEI